MAEPVGFSLAAPFEEGVSVLHRTDPRLKVLLAGMLALSVALTRAWPSLWALLAFSVLLVFLARIPLIPLLKRLAALDGILLLLWITLPLSGGGGKIFMGPIPLSVEGISLAAAITVRSHAAVMGFVALLGTNPVHRTMRALRFFRIPEKLVLLLHFTYRYGHVLFDEAGRLHRSMALRAFTPGLNLRTLEAYGNLMGMVFLKAFHRAERVSAAMELRGFKGTFPDICPAERVDLSQWTRCAGLGVLLLGCLIL